MPAAKKQLTIAYLVSGLENSYDQALIPGVYNVMEANNAHLLILPGRELGTPVKTHAQQHVVYDLINRDRIDGIIMLTGTLNSYVGIEEIREFYQKYKPIPIVSIGMKTGDLHDIIVDNSSGMKEAVRHLILGHGHRRIAFIRGPRLNEEADIRYQAYLSVLQEQGIDYNPELVVDGDFSPYSVPAALANLIDKRENPFDALITANDDMAFGVISEFKKRGIRIPDDIALVGFDDVSNSKYCCPSLTTVRQPLYEMGREAARSILDLAMGKETPKLQTLDTHLVIRQSCGCMSETISKIIKSQEVQILSQRRNRKEYLEASKKKIGPELTLMLKDDPNESARTKADTILDGVVVCLCTDAPSGIFLNKIAALMTYDIDNGTPLDYWQDIVTFLHNSFTGCLEYEEYRLKYDTLFHSIRILVNEMIHFGLAVNQRRVEYQLWQLRNSIQSLVESFDLSHLLNVLSKELPELGITRCYLSIYEKTVLNRLDGSWELPENATLIFSFNQKKDPQVNLEPQKYKTALIVPNELFYDNDHYALVVKPLYYGEDHFGFIFMDLGHAEETVHETLLVLISSVIKGAFLVQAFQKSENTLKYSLRQLEEANNKLRLVSLTDELTGLYNRRGFSKLAEQHYKYSSRTGENFFIIFADFDGLKTINDNFGHLAGDDAIINTARLLKNTFRDTDTIGRMGGDEFIILVTESTKDTLNVILSRLENEIKLFNEKAGKCYKISISIGVAENNESENPGLDEIINLADKRLYSNKQERKKQENKKEDKNENRFQ